MEAELTLQVGGRLNLFLDEWHNITADRWVLEVIQKGYALQFTQVPPSNQGVKCTSVPKDLDAKKVLHQEIQTLFDNMS
jgi:hypothetical protein